jgi:hypothetical protein
MSSVPSALHRINAWENPPMDPDLNSSFVVYNVQSAGIHSTNTTCGINASQKLYSH